MEKKQLANFMAYLADQPRGFTYRGHEKNDFSTSKKLEKLYFCHKKCYQCPLGSMGRTQVVFGRGNPDARLIFVGEGPGRDEDRQGLPFVGRAGQLLERLIAAMGLSCNDVYITNVVKCRPPSNRTPMPNESDVCKSLILQKELEIMTPEIICTLGATATKALLGDDVRISQARGNFFHQEEWLVIPTYHPAYLLRNPAAKRDVWSDMLKICDQLSLSPRTKK